MVESAAVRCVRRIGDWGTTGKNAWEDLELLAICAMVKCCDWGKRCSMKQIFLKVFFSPETH